MSTAAAAAKSLQSSPTLCDPIDGNLLGSPSLGFSRQEHWSRLPFPSPMQESEKWKWSRSVMSDPQRLHGLQPSRLLRPWGFPGKSTGVGCHCLLWWKAHFTIFVSFFFFWCGPFLKSLLNLLQYCFCFMFCFFPPQACVILAPQSGIKPATSALEGEVLTTGPPRKSLETHFI